MFVMRRIVVLDHLDQFKCEIAPSDVDAIDVVEELNGPHTLTISSTNLHLTVGDRVLSPRDRATQYAQARDYSEWVVSGIKSRHDPSGSVRTEYTCIWFVQYDALTTYIDTTVGVTPFQESVLKTPTQWFEATIGSGDNTPPWQLSRYPSTMAAASFYNMDGWECIKRFLERWGGELDCFTTATEGMTVMTSSRKLWIPDKMGRSTPVWRFDFGWDVENVERNVNEGAWGCRVVPLGKSTQTANGGYTRRPTISSVNGGVPWLENPSVVPLVRRPRPGGYYIYPTVFAKNDVYEEPAELKAWAEEHLDELTQPKVTYKFDAVLTGEMGFDYSVIRLGDTVAVVDDELVEGGIRIEVRVRRMEYSLLSDTSPVKLTLGNETPSITNALQETNNEVGIIREQMDLQQT